MTGRGSGTRTHTVGKTNGFLWLMSGAAPLLSIDVLLLHHTNKSVAATYYAIPPYYKKQGPKTLTSKKVIVVWAFNYERICPISPFLVYIIT